MGQISWIYSDLVNYFILVNLRITQELLVCHMKPWSFWVSFLFKVSNSVTIHSPVCVCVYMCAQSCLTLCDSMDCSLPWSTVHGVLQARILEWVALPFSRGTSWPRDWTCVSYVSCIGRWVLYHNHHPGSTYQDFICFPETNITVCMNNYAPYLCLHFPIPHLIH